MKFSVIFVLFTLSVMVKALSPFVIVIWQIARFPVYGLTGFIVSVVSDANLPWVDTMRKPFISKSGKTFLYTNPKKQKAK